MTTEMIWHPFGEFVASKRELHEDHASGSPLEQYRFRFPNGYGASVVRGQHTYGGAEGLWELGVTDCDDRLTYDTPITSDVIGHLTEFDVGRTLEAIAKLPQADG